MSRIETNVTDMYSILLVYKNTGNHSDSYSNTIEGDGDYQQQFVFVEKTDSYPVKNEFKYKNDFRRTDFKITNLDDFDHGDGTRVCINNDGTMSSPEMTYTIPGDYDQIKYLGRDSGSYTKAVWNSLLKGTFGQKSGSKYYIYMYASWGSVKLKNTSRIYLDVHYSTTPPKIVSENGIFKIERPDDTYRKMRVTISKAVVTPGMRTSSNARVIFRLLDVTGSQEIPVWEKTFSKENYVNNQDDDGNPIFDEEGNYVFETLPYIFSNEDRKYQFRVVYDIASLDYALWEEGNKVKDIRRNQDCRAPIPFSCPPPRMFAYPSIELRMDGEELKLSTDQQNFHSMLSVLSGDKIRIHWSDPLIRNASGLRINFQILIGVKVIPARIGDRNILPINVEEKGELLR